MECRRQDVGLDRLAFLLLAYSYAVDHSNALPTEADLLNMVGIIEPSTGGRYRITPVSFAGGGSASAAGTVRGAVARLFGLLDAEVKPEEFVHNLLKIHPFGDGNCRVAFILLNWLLSVTYPTSTGPVVETYGYNNNGTTNSLAVTGGSTTAGSYTYSYENGTNDRPLLQSAVHGTVTTTYSYSVEEQLSAATGTGTGATTQTYTYDGDGNLRTQDLSGAIRTRAYNSDDELCWSYGNTTTNTCASPPTGSTVFSYDNDGNQTSASTGLALAYNPLNQATSMTDITDVSVTAMGYTGINNAQRTTIGSTTATNNLYGVAATTTSGTATYFTRDPNGRLNSMLVGGSRYYYLYDGQGNIIGLINSTGTQDATYSYDPYGNLTSSAPTGVAATNPYRYKGGYTDPTGYIKFGARYYSPNLGSWTQQDPTGQNPGYNYAGSDPINNTDPTGEFSLGDLVSTVTAGLGIGIAAALCPETAGFGCAVAAGIAGGAVGGALGEDVSGGSPQDNSGAAFLGAVGGFIGGIGALF